MPMSAGDGAAGLVGGLAGDVGVFALAERKLAWIDGRQRILAQNIANADTPGYRPHDAAPFTAALGRALAPMATSPLHLPGQSHAASGSTAPSVETAPDGNAVDVEDQLTRVAQDETAQALVTNIWKSYMGLFTTALGH